MKHDVRRSPSSPAIPPTGGPISDRLYYTVDVTHFITLNTVRYTTHSHSTHNTKHYIQYSKRKRNPTNKERLDSVFFLLSLGVELEAKC